MADSNRSLWYLTVHDSPSRVSATSRARSKLDTPVSMSNASIVRPGNSRCFSGVFVSRNVTWKSGLWLRFRSGCSSSTSFSKGRSAWACAPSVTSRTRPNSSRNVGLPERSVLSTSVLVKNPINPSVSARLRPAIGEPTTMSSCPV